MPEFKVGDRVRSRENTSHARRGNEGVVVLVDSNGTWPVKVDYDNGQCEIHAHSNLEMVEPAAAVMAERVARLREVGATHFPVGTVTTERLTFAGGGMRDSQAGKPRFELMYPERVPFADQLMTRCAVHMAAGAEKYADRNWENFSDAESLERAKASALRLMNQWITGETDEDHAAAVVFNLMAAEYVRGRINGDW